MANLLAQKALKSSKSSLIFFIPYDRPLYFYVPISIYLKVNALSLQIYNKNNVDTNMIIPLNGKYNRYSRLYPDENNMFVCYNIRIFNLNIAGL